MAAADVRLGLGEVDVPLPLLLEPEKIITQFKQCTNDLQCELIVLCVITSLELVRYLM